METWPYMTSQNPGGHGWKKDGKLLRVWCSDKMILLLTQIELFERSETELQESNEEAGGLDMLEKVK